MSPLMQNPPKTKVNLCSHLLRMIEPNYSYDVKNFKQYKVEFTSRSHHLVNNRKVKQIHERFL